MGFIDDCKPPAILKGMKYKLTLMIPSESFTKDSMYGERWTVKKQNRLGDQETKYVVVSGTQKPEKMHS